MQLDCNQFFQVFPVDFGEITKKRIIVYSASEKSLNIFLLVHYEQFHIREKVLCQILA